MKNNYVDSFVCGKNKENIVLTVQGFSNSLYINFWSFCLTNIGCRTELTVRDKADRKLGQG